MTSKWSQVLRGVAFGDSWGSDNEFLRYEQLTAENPRGPELPEKLIVTDDTQMTLALARGLDAARVAQKSAGVLDIQTHVLDEFLTWYRDPDNNRAPGTTCLSACHLLSLEEPWWSASVADSDGCGAVMRVAPAAFLPDGLWKQVSTWQAASTHGHPAAIASALIAAAVIRYGVGGRISRSRPVLDQAIELTRDTAIRHGVADWISEHPLAGSPGTAWKLVDLGMQHVREALIHAKCSANVFIDDPWGADPSDPKYGGLGWNAQTCLATALLCVDMFPDDPIEALRRATVTGGDSDSIAAVTGAILGALHDNPWPAEWADRLEPRYQKWIAEADTYRFE